MRRANNPATLKNIVTKAQTLLLNKRTDLNGLRPRPEHGHDLWIATWNVLSLYRAGALARLVEELAKYNITIAALQEIRWKSSDTLKTKDYTIFYSNKDKNTLGTGFAVSHKIIDKVIGFRPENERLCSMRIRGKMFNITFINAHAPTEDSEECDKDSFYENLEKLYDHAPRHDVKIVLGDFNAKIGKEKAFRPTIGKESLHEESNNNGTRLIDFATGKGMSISSTKFPHKNIHKITWTSPDGSTKNQIDHVLIDKRHGSDILDVRSYRGADADSDHTLVKIRYKQRISSIYNSQNKRQKCYDSQKLMKDPIVADTFKTQLKQKLINGRTENEDMDNDINKHWDIIKNAVKSTTEEIIGYKPSYKRAGWFDNECRKILDDRNKARMIMIQRETRNTRQLYIEARKKATKLCRKKKREWEKAKLLEIEELSRNKDVRGMYMKIKDEKNGFQARPHMCENKQGELIAESSRVLERWAEYFEELLNKPSMGEKNTQQYNLPYGGPDPFVNTPTLEETIKGIMTLKNYKAPGEDLITAELIKYGGRELHIEIHKLIGKIWLEEKMPIDWETALVTPIHKKGSKLNCANYRGISLLNVTYKVMSKLIASRLQDYTENILGDYQCGFRPNRSTNDQIFTIRCLLEKCYEYNIPVHQLYIDYKMAYDSINRNYLYETLELFGIPNKLTRLIHMTLNRSRSKIKVQGEYSREFSIQQGLRQGDTLSCLLFNLVLERVIRNIKIDTKGTIKKYFNRDDHSTHTSGTLYSQPLQYLAYADDIALLGKNSNAIQQALTELEDASKLAGLEISDLKTKYMIMRRSDAKEEDREDLKTKDHTFERVETFKYLGSNLNENNELLPEIKERIAAGNRAYYSLQNILRSKNISKRTKKAIYKTTIRPVVMYSSETWTTTKSIENMLNTWERKVLRKIYGAVQDKDGWRTRTNEEIYALYEDPTIVAEIKKGRLRWAGHVERMAKDRATRIVYHQRPRGKRLRGRPRQRWLEAVEADLQELGVRAWRRKASDRPEWKAVVEQAKALHGL